MIAADKDSGNLEVRQDFAGIEGEDFAGIEDFDFGVNSDYGRKLPKKMEQFG